MPPRAPARPLYPTAADAAGICSSLAQVDHLPFPLAGS